MKHKRKIFTCDHCKSEWSRSPQRSGQPPEAHIVVSHTGQLRDGAPDEFTKPRYYLDFCSLQCLKGFLAAADTKAQA